MATALLALYFALLKAGIKSDAPKKRTNVNMSRNAHCCRNNCQSEMDSSSGGSANWRATSSCNRRRADGCNLSGSLASARRFFA